MSCLRPLVVFIPGELENFFDRSWVKGYPELRNSNFHARNSYTIELVSIVPRVPHIPGAVIQPTCDPNVG